MIADNLLIFITFITIVWNLLLNQCSNKGWGYDIIDTLRLFMPMFSINIEPPK